MNSAGCKGASKIGYIPGLLKQFFNFTRMLDERSSVSPNNIPYAVMKFYAVTPLRDGTAVTAPCVNFPSSIGHS